MEQKRKNKNWQTQKKSQLKNKRKKVRHKSNILIGFRTVSPCLFFFDPMSVLLLKLVIWYSLLDTVPVSDLFQRHREFFKFILFTCVVIFIWNHFGVYQVL